MIAEDLAMIVTAGSTKSDDIPLDTTQLPIIQTSTFILYNVFVPQMQNMDTALDVKKLKHHLQSLQFYKQLLYEQADNMKQLAL